HIIEPIIFHIGEARISVLQIIIIVAATAIMGALLLVVHRTRLGTAMRAPAQNREGAGLLGVNHLTVISAGIGIGQHLVSADSCPTSTARGWAPPCGPRRRTGRWPASWASTSTRSFRRPSSSVRFWPRWLASWSQPTMGWPSTPWASFSA